MQKIFDVASATDKKNAVAPTTMPTIRDREVAMGHAVVDAMADAVDEIRRRRQIMALQDCIF